jgi:hypothetical protein
MDQRHRVPTGGQLEAYILTALCLVVWVATVALFKFLMPGNENAFIIGSLAGLVMAAAAAGLYYNHLASPPL